MAKDILTRSFLGHQAGIASSFDEAWTSAKQTSEEYLVDAETSHPQRQPMIDLKKIGNSYYWKLRRY